MGGGWGAGGAVADCGGQCHWGLLSVGEEQGVPTACRWLQAAVVTPITHTCAQDMFVPAVLSVHWSKGASDAACVALHPTVWWVGLLSASLVVFAFVA